MKVFCPNCGTENEGMPGGRLTCKACTASFEVPRETGWVAAPAPPEPIAPPKPVAPPPQPPNLGFQGPPPTGFTRGDQSLPINALAITSVVLGVLCCLAPFSSLAAVITGLLAKQQIAASQGQQRGNEYATIGMVLGALTLVLACAGLIINLVTAQR